MLWKNSPPKMSEIMKELAFTCLRFPEAMPSPEAAHAALLFAHIAWNRALGHDTPEYEELLDVFLRSNSGLWSEFRSRDPEALIETMRQVKEQRYPEDRRAIVVCGMREGNIRVEWCEEKDFPEAVKLAANRLAAEHGPGRVIGKRRSRKGT